MARKKKILYLVTKSNWGGAQRYVFDLASNVTEQFDVSVAAGGRGSLFDKLRENNISYIELKSAKRDISFLSEIKLFKELFSIIRREKPDVLHVNSSKLGGLGAFMGRLLFVKKIVFTVHGWPFNEAHRSAFSKFIIKCFSWLTVVFAHQTIIINNHDFLQARKLPFVKNKFKLIYLGIEQFDIKPREQARKLLREKAGKKGGKNLWVGTIAEHTENKGLPYLIRSFVYLKDKASLVLIGDGEKKQELEKEIEVNDLGNNVYMPGYISDAKSYLNAFDIFVLPSRKEGLPYVLLEAGMAGLPIVATRVGGVPDIVGGVGILVSPENTSELKDAILNLLKSEKLRKELGEKAKQKIEKTFRLGTMAEETKELYED